MKVSARVDCGRHPSSWQSRPDLASSHAHRCALGDSAFFFFGLPFPRRGTAFGFAQVNKLPDSSRRVKRGLCVKGRFIADIQMTQQEQIEKRLGQMPQTMRNTYQKAMRGRSQKAAIASFCFECVGYARAEVRLCTDLGCPLYPYRPTAGFIGTRTVRRETVSRIEQVSVGGISHG